MSDGVDDVDDRDDRDLAALAAGTLDPDRARAVRARVAADPRLLARYGALRAARPGGGAAPAAGFRDGPGGDGPGGIAAGDGPARVTPARVAVVGAAAVLVVAALVAAARPAPDRTAPPATVDVTPVVSLPADRLATLWPDLARQPPDLGFLTEQGRVPGCFGILGAPEILGARPVVVDGRYGVAVAWTDPDDPGPVRIVVYGRGCGPFTDDGVLARTTVPR